MEVTSSRMGVSSACVNGSLMGVKPSGCGVLAGGRPVLADRRKLQLRTSFNGSQLGGKGPSTDAPIISSMSCLGAGGMLRTLAHLFSRFRKQPPNGDRRSTGGSWKFGLWHVRQAGRW